MVLVAAATKSLLLFSFLYYVFLLSAAANHDHRSGHGFSVELIHRDSPKSPLYNPSETASQRVANAIRRSISRSATRFSSQISPAPAAAPGPGSAQSTLFPDDGEYLMTISIGTPPFQILAIADTGSDLTWTQCKPCTHCYNQTAPLFDPKSSQTYKNISCASDLCKSASGAITSCSQDSSCQYSVSYGDGSFSDGNLATDTITLSSTSGRPVLFPKFVIGCGYDDEGTFTKEEAGIVGLGGGSTSLISQMGSSIGGKFSYCLVPDFDPDSETKNSSKLNFGSKAVVSGPGAVSTPLFSGGEVDTFYYLTLEGVSVAGINGSNSKYLKFKTSSGSTDVTEGNIIIDSGTTITIVPEEFYSDLESAVDEEMTKSHAKRVEDPTGFFNLCYASPEESKSSDDLHYPVVTMHFKGGADVNLSGSNTFVRVSEDVVCFSIVPSQGFSIYGNLAQMNFLVGYDRQQNTVTFMPTDCTKYN